MLSARAGEEATVEGLEAGADDYLVKPFTAARAAGPGPRQPRARPGPADPRRARAQPRAARPGRSALARVGSWEIDLATERGRAARPSSCACSAIDRRRAARGRPRGRAGVRPRRRPRARRRARSTDAVEPARRSTSSAASSPPDGAGARSCRARGVAAPRRRRRAGRRCAAATRTSPSSARPRQARRIAAATAEAAAREHRIADELQRSLLPGRRPRPRAPRGRHPTTAPASRAPRSAATGTTSSSSAPGGPRSSSATSWAAACAPRRSWASSGPRSARSPGSTCAPADMLELLDGVVRDLGEDQIVTCVYAVYDPTDGTLVYANAGPPAAAAARRPAARRAGSTAARRRWAAARSPSTEHQVRVPDGGAASRSTPTASSSAATGDVDAGIDALADGAPRRPSGPIESLPGALVDALLPDGPDDDVAVLVARVPPAGAGGSVGDPRDRAPSRARSADARELRRRGAAPRADVDEAVVHRRRAAHERARHERASCTAGRRSSCACGSPRAHVVLEVYDGTAVLPRKLRPTPDDEHGRGLQLVASLARRWGTRPLPARQVRLVHRRARPRAGRPDRALSRRPRRRHSP